MTTQATGDETDPAAEEPNPAADEPGAGGPLEPALNPLQRLIQQRLRERGWSYRQVARRGGPPHSTVHTLAATPNLARPPGAPDPAPPAAPGHHRRPGQGPGRAGLGGPRRRRRVHRAALLRRGPRRAGEPRRPGAGAPDRQHRRADTRGAAPRGRAGRIAPEQGRTGAGRLVNAAGPGRAGGPPRPPPRPPAA